MSHDISHDNYLFTCIYRNTATLTVKQELLFVGQESGKLIAVREIISKVKVTNSINHRNNYSVSYNVGFYSSSSRVRSEH